MKYVENNSNSFGARIRTSAMNTEDADAALQRCLNRLTQTADDADARQMVSEVISVAAGRILSLCDVTLTRHYPRLAKGPFNVHADELLGAVTERLIKAMRSVRPTYVREFFALVMKHIRWELNAVARRLDADRHEPLTTDVAVHEPEANDEQFSPLGQRILEAVNDLPEIDRDIFNMVRVSGMTHLNAAEVLGISERTVERRLSRILQHLWAQLGAFQLPQGTELLRNRTLRPQFAGAEGSATEQSPKYVA
jgi:RNA polymerase sigma-70 factor (ECF subfamily)